MPPHAAQKRSTGTPYRPGFGTLASSGAHTRPPQTSLAGPYSPLRREDGIARSRPRATPPYPFSPGSPQAKELRTRDGRSTGDVRSACPTSSIAIQGALLLDRMMTPNRKLIWSPDQSLPWRGRPHTPGSHRDLVDSRSRCDSIHDQASTIVVGYHRFVTVRVMVTWCGEPRIRMRLRTW
jgi:hypothetical protein